MPVPDSLVQAPPRRLQRRLGLLGRAESIPIRGPENGLEENSWVSVGFLAVRDGLGEGLGAQPDTVTPPRQGSWKAVEATPLGKLFLLFGLSFLICTMGT